MTSRPDLAELGLNARKMARLNRILHQHGVRSRTALLLHYEQGLEPRAPRDFFANSAASDPRYIARVAAEGGFNGIAIHEHDVSLRFVSGLREILAKYPRA